MKRKALQKTLDSKVSKWKRILKLSDWNIKIKYAPQKVMDKDKKPNEEDTIGMLDECYVIEKRAQILISEKYQEIDGYGIGWNLDTVILHELIHIVMRPEEDKLASKVTKSAKFGDLLEFICDKFSDIIYEMTKRKKVKKS